MFDKFGEVDSAEELNQAAKGFLNEGDLESLRAFAKENGLGEDVEDYIEGLAPELATISLAAFGKLNAEEEDLKPKDIMVDWTNYIRMVCGESEEMARQVRKKEKSLKGCIAVLLKWSFDHQQNIDPGIIKAAGIKAGRVTIGIPGMATAKKLIRDYYMR